MGLRHYVWLIWGGLAMMLLGIIFPLLMVVKIMESTFFLNFASYILSLGGMIMGTFGLAFYSIKTRKK